MQLKLKYSVTLVFGKLYDYTLLILPFQVIFQLSMIVMKEVSFKHQSIGLPFNPFRSIKQF
jgi:hypothetical protein